jgi:dATP pyrophosphohydrolase
MITVFVVRPDEAGDSHEFLQLHRIPGDYMGGTWQIIRGGVESGETYVEAALRELGEEAGLVPAEFYRLGTVETFYTTFEDTLWHAPAFCAIVPRAAQVKLNDEHDAYRWVHRQRIEVELMWASERQLLRDLARDILEDSETKSMLRIALEQ